MAMIRMASQATACSCECGDSDWEDDAEDDWTFCECTGCGPPGQGCTVRCSEVLRIKVAMERGKNTGVVARAMLEDGDSIDKNEHPKFCGDCIEHGLLDLRRKAVQRRRNAEQEGPAAKRVCNAASTGSMPSSGPAQ